MPLPTARHAMPDVGTARGQGSRADACARPQIGGLLWCGQFEYKEIHTCHVREVRRSHLRELSEEAATASLAQQAHGRRAGQCQVPPRRTSQAIAAEISIRAQLAVSTAVQPAVGTNRAGLEADPSNGYAQLLLRNPGRRAQSSRAMLRPLATTQFGAASTMRHYLRRDV